MMGRASNRAQGQKRSGKNDEDWANLTPKERGDYIQDAAVARGEASNIAQGKRDPARTTRTGPT